MWSSSVEVYIIASCCRYTSLEFQLSFRNYPLAWRVIASEWFPYSSLYSSLVNKATNWGPQSETTCFGRPWSFQTWWRKSLAASSTVTVVCIETKCTLLETESTTVMMASCPEDSTSSTTKLTLSVSHRTSRIESGWSSPTGEYRQGFVRRQRSQVLTYWLIYLDIWGHQ